MARWTKPSEELPGEDVYVGDRIVGIVRDREIDGGPCRCRLILMTATEFGWENEDGYAPEDCLLWSTEADVCRIAEII